jgi:hypothetical protein
VATLASLFVAVYYQFPYAVGLWFGALWGCLNFFFIAALVKALLTPAQPIRWGNVIVTLGIKFPLLYGLGYLLLIWRYAPAASYLVGFSLLIAVTILKALGRILLGLDTKSLFHLTETRK